MELEEFISIHHLRASQNPDPCEVVKPDYTAAAVPPDSSLANDPATPRLGDLWRVGAAFGRHEGWSSGEPGCVS